MGRDLGRAVPMRRPAPLIDTRSIGGLLAALLVALVAVVVCAGPASAVDPTPSPDPFATEASTPSVSPPSQRQIDDAKAALERLRNQGRQTPAPIQQVAGPTSGAAGGASVVSRISDEAWWTIAAGLLVLLVASETTRLSVRRAKHRKGA